MEGRPIEASSNEGIVPSNEAIALEVLTALMEEEEDVTEMPTLQRKRRWQRSPKQAVKAAEVPSGVEPPTQHLPLEPTRPEGSRGKALPIPKPSLGSVEGAPRSVPLGKKRLQRGGGHLRISFWTANMSDGRRFVQFE